MIDEPLDCEHCGTRVPPTEATRAETYGDLDATRWHTLCCPRCGARLRTVFVGDE